MKIFDLHRSIISDYSNYIQSFINIKDKRIREVVEKDLDNGSLWPEPLIQFNPTFQSDKSIDDLIAEGKIHHDLARVFKGYRLYRHQVEAIERGINGESFIVTSGTGSGKSLTFLATIFNDLLKNNTKKGIKAVLVYPMNALINSQEDEINKYAENYGENFPISFAQYTGQTGTPNREQIANDEPDIILTNYMMLELIMTRSGEDRIRNSIFKNLQYLVFDELHTYRGRQGSDVAMLIRRIQSKTKNDLICIGTSATMASGTTIDDEKKQVADVGNQIFNYPFQSDQIIGEYFENCTIGGLPEENELVNAFNDEIGKEGSTDEFIRHPIARWLENRIAIQYYPDGIHQKRGAPKTLTDIVEILNSELDVDKSHLNDKMIEFLTWSENLNVAESKKDNRKSYLPFKFHQFIAQTGNVSVTLESISKRKITLETARYIKEGNDDIDLYPVLFSRISGHEFICVHKDLDTKTLKPRNPDEFPQKITKEELKGKYQLDNKRRKLTQNDFQDGYVLLKHHQDEIFWDNNMLEDFPETWKSTKKGVEELDNYYEYRVPTKIYINEFHQYSENDNGGIEAWFIPTYILYDPTAGIIYDQRTSEYTKLMRLGNEGRSTATTITALSTVQALARIGIEPEYQKLLSFTDNRQDASLQAGHFNDFVSTIRLRSAIYHAVERQVEIRSSEIAKHAADALNLKEKDYARYPSENPKYKEASNTQALGNYLFIRILYDLKRGWRYNTPNLEQCALLEIDYENLDQLAKDDEEWGGNYLFENLDYQDRKRILHQILDFFRTSYAIDHYKLSRDQRGIIEEQIKEKLDTEKNWSLNVNEKIDTPYIMLPRSAGDTQRGIYTAGCGSQSYLGKYFKRLFNQYGLQFIKGEGLTELIELVLNIMVGANLLKREKVVGKKGEVTGYQLRLDQVIWKRGDKKNVLSDDVRINSFQPIENKPNTYFQSYYQADYSILDNEIKGAEHTGQLDHEKRETRERDFKEGKLSTLFCSPTMELGIDISSMNVVHMRNVPPGPANYAQRGGRAGRSGQTALVMTYCSNGSPHDRHYFSHKQDMVAGVVAAPKLDLTNEELIRSHLHAYILMEMGLPIFNSVAEVIDRNDPKLPIKDDLTATIVDQLFQFKNEWINQFKYAISSVASLLNQTHWFSDAWLHNQFQNFPKSFDRAFDRWRNLYLDAQLMIERARQIQDDPTFKAGSQERKNANRDQYLGQRQKDLLLNDNPNQYTSQSEFYIFRYLASEGFLPGYNFTRLPIRAFLGDRERGEFVSRPRFIALKEFGPNNLIYHAGSKYRITRMMTTHAEEKLHYLKFCKESGYVYLDDEAKSANNDPITKNPLNGEERVEIKPKVVELAESQTRPEERISCEEEERTSQGYDIEQYFSFSSEIDEITKTVLSYDGEKLLNILYGPSARLLQFNRKWRKSKQEDENGFRMGMNTGFWKKAKDEENPNVNDPIERVQVFTSDTADVLYLEPIKALKIDKDGVISLTYAIKRAIELVYQIEERELGAWVMGKTDNPNILLYEAAEGSLGVLSDIVKNPDKLKEVFRKAYQVCHYDPNTLLETEKGKNMPKASYEDLLSYYNQRFHEQISRESIRRPLELLMGATIDSTVSMKGNYKEQYKELEDQYDKKSKLEKRFLDYLQENGLRLPDKTQQNLESYFISADFVYIDEKSGESSLVFIDGSVHDQSEVKEQDQRKRQALIDAGYDVLVYRYDQSIKDFVESRKDIFRKVVSK